MIPRIFRSPLHKTDRLNDTNLSFINWKIDRLITSRTNMSAPCAQFQMSIIRKIMLPGVSKNEIISKIHAMTAIRKSDKYNCTLKVKDTLLFSKIKFAWQVKNSLFYMFGWWSFLQIKTIFIGLFGCCSSFTCFLKIQCN